VRGEPIVCSPDDAYRCFMNTEMDYLILGNFVIDRLAQPKANISRRVQPQGD
jgi:carbamoyltransferase